MTPEERAALCVVDIWADDNGRVNAAKIIAAAIEAAEQAAMVRQHAADCARLCPDCSKGYKVIKSYETENWAHVAPMRLSNETQGEVIFGGCMAWQLWDAWAAAHPTPTP